MYKIALIFLFALLLVSCAENIELDKGVEIMDKEVATFAGGCFWCIEAFFQEVDGVIDAVNGYAGGEKENPSYEEVSSGTTGYLETVQITYDPSKISYKELLDLFWRQIDPTDSGGQFVDRGSQYGTAIFYHNEEQKKIAEESKKEIEKKLDKEIKTKILALDKFYKAEEYHQDFYKKRTLQYQAYKKGSGREILDKIWKKDEENLKSTLTPMQYKVTQEDGTEAPFDNEYWDNKKEGIYVDLVSGEALFSSEDKFESGTGWPSFTKPLEENNVVEKSDRKLLIKRIEVRSKGADSHLGHVFKDGPAPTGLRYCVNSAALKFISKEDLDKFGYSKYKKLFD